MRRSPEWVFAAQHADQLADLFRHRWAAGLAATNLPAPEQAEALTLPSDHGGGLDDGNAGLPAVPDRGQPGPEKAVRGGQLGALDGTLEDADLMAQSKDFQLKRGTGPKRSAEEGEQGR